MSNIGTGIEWTDTTWNPTTGCRKVSPGCDNCYAATLARRLKAMGNPRYQNDGVDGPGFGLTLHWDKLEEPLRWRRPRRVFVNSMSDLFIAGVPSDFLDLAFDVMAQAVHHQFQILTKRPTRMAREIPRIVERLGFIPQNIWLGTSVENQEWGDKRIPPLLQTPAAVRFLSCEPLLGHVDLKLDQTEPGETQPRSRQLHWIIAGGESGIGHRDIEEGWVRALRDQCSAAGIAYFFKRWGGITPKAGGRELDGRTWDEMPRTLTSSSEELAVG